MNIMQVLEQLAELKPHQYDDKYMYRWLSELDRRIYNQVWRTHEGVLPDFVGYDEDTTGETVLLVDAPYDDMYLKYLESQVDYYNGEYDRYNNSAAAFNALYEGYRAWYNRTHMPKQIADVHGVI